MSNEISLSNVLGSKELLAKTLKSGGQSVTFIHRKEYGAAHNLKGAKLTRAHKAYQLDYSRQMGGAISKGIGAGELFVTRISRNAKGSAINAHFVTDLHADVSAGKQSKLESENAALRAQLDALTAAFAAMGKPAAAPAPAAA